jgi:hypothetical protein
MFFLLFLLNDRRIRIRNRISDTCIWIREAQKHMDPDPQQWCLHSKKDSRQSSRERCQHNANSDWFPKVISCMLRNSSSNNALGPVLWSRKYFFRFRLRVGLKDSLKITFFDLINRIKIVTIYKHFFSNQDLLL